MGTAEFSLFFEENISNSLTVFSKILFPRLLDSFPPNAGTVYFKRAKEKPFGVPPHSCPGAGGSCPHKGNCFRLRIFECFEQMGFQEESNRRNWGTNFTETEEHLWEFLASKQRKIAIGSLKHL